MAEYIDRENYCKNICRCSREKCDKAKCPIWAAPVADVREVVRGKWIVVEPEYLNCSVCGEAMYSGCNSTKEAILLKDHWKNFCPNCGADMREKMEK